MNALLREFTRMTIVVMMKGVMENNSKCLYENTRVCKFVDLGSKGLFLGDSYCSKKSSLRNI